MSDDKKIRIAECQNYIPAAIERIKKATDDEVLNSLLYLAYIYVYSNAEPGTDMETMKILALHMAKESLDNPKMDARHIFDLDGSDEEKPIIQ